MDQTGEADQKTQAATSVIVLRRVVLGDALAGEVDYYHDAFVLRYDRARYPTLGALETLPRLATITHGGAVAQWQSTVQCFGDSCLGGQPSPSALPGSSGHAIRLLVSYRDTCAETAGEIPLSS